MAPIKLFKTAMNTEQ